MKQSEHAVDVSCRGLSLYANHKHINTIVEIWWNLQRKVKSKLLVQVNLKVWAKHQNKSRTEICFVVLAKINKNKAKVNAAKSNRTYHNDPGWLCDQNNVLNFWNVWVWSLCPEGQSDVWVEVHQTGNVTQQLLFTFLQLYLVILDLKTQLWDRV